MRIRRALKTGLVALATGALTVSAAWAGAGLIPVSSDSPVEDVTSGLSQSADDDAAPQTPQDAMPTETATASAAVSAGSAAPRPGEFLVGASKVSMEPRPDDYGGTWETEGCVTFGDDAQQGATHVADFRVKWPENPNCIYMGGYGIGPMNPITTWNEEYGLWVRSLAISDGTDTVVLTLVDGVSYFGEYRDMCDGCGAHALAEEIGAAHGFDPAGFFLVSTHSHTAPDFIGGWGGVPDWYMQQITDAIKTSVADAIANMESAVIEVGESFARRHSGERRDFYRSAEDNSESWFRAYVTPGGSGGAAGDAGAPGARVIATVGAFAAHPVTADESTGIADGDFPVVFETRVEEAFGGVGFFFQSGLGNMSPRGSTEEMGNGLAAEIPPVGSGARLTNTDVRAAKAFWDQPVTNSGLTALGLPGFFDRPFAQQPATVVVGHEVRGCKSASPVSVNVAANVARIGTLTITGAPGETFANLSNTIEEKAPGVALALAQANDGLGYLVQSFETDHAGRQGVGFVGEVAEYEDAYSIDHCFGDKTLETTLQLMQELYTDE